MEIIKSRLTPVNSKIKKSFPKAKNFGIPAVKTCPMAGTCRDGGCFGEQGMYVMPNVKEAYEYRFQLTRLPDFSRIMIDAIKRQKLTHFRIHDIGDFYSKDYFAKWLTIVAHNPTVHFYAYTKMVAMVKEFQRETFFPKNLTIIFSEGGKQDHLIDRATDRHSRVFATVADLQATDYADASHNDSIALGSNKKIGLVYHGAPSKAWVSA